MAYPDDSIFIDGPNLSYSEKQPTDLDGFVRRFLECVDICKETLGSNYVGFVAQQNWAVKAGVANMAKSLVFMGRID